ncbi:MAG: 30S ribosomal protein S6, partial [Actinobacteria bacterium]|nr:30S ribosomal protein S6 [Actinomycetota bacterium]
NGYYFLFYFSGNGIIFTDINRVSNINDRVLRHLIVARSDKNKIFA